MRLSLSKPGLTNQTMTNNKIAYNYFVYINECNDKSYYTGVTNDLERRMWERNEGFIKGCYTYERRPVVFKYSELFSDIIQAIAREKQLKGWSRKKKEALFAQDWAEISRLVKSKKSVVAKEINQSSTSSD